ncbi:MAG: BatA domain-containing protein, partial [Planctomycetaceae bacterium]
MSLINPLLLYGLGLASIPVILHFLLRAKPKKLMFPALRIIRIRRKTNVRRMRLRHIWLLLLRIAVIAAIVMALTRPPLPAANYSFTLREWISLAAILIVSLAVYWLLLRRWKQQRLPNHMLAYRRSILRGAAACVGLLAFLLLVAWPYQQRVTAEMTSPRPKVSENIPVAAVFLFDTSLSMDYQSEGKTRLQKAIEIATKHASDLPVGSRVGVAGTGRDTPVLLPPDRAGAVARMQELKTSPVRVSINQRLRTAIRVQQRNRER